MILSKQVLTLALSIVWCCMEILEWVCSCLALCMIFALCLETEGVAVCRHAQNGTSFASYVASVKKECMVSSGG